MRNSRGILIYLLVISITNSCGIKSIQTTDKNNDYSNREQGLEYYYAFTEATKQAMFNNYKDAITLYLKCLKYNPESAATNFQLSNIYMRLGDIDLAKKYAKDAVNKDDKNIWYYLHLAGIYQMQRDIDSTVMVYEKIVELDDSKIEYRYNLALLYKEAGYYEKALKAVKWIESRIGLNERIIYLKHDLYSRLKRKKEAINTLREGIRFYPENVNMYGLLAEYLTEIGEYEEAGNVYNVILMKDTTNSKVILSYADYLIGLGNVDRAFVYYKKAIEEGNMNLNEKILVIAAMINDEIIFKSAAEQIGNLIDNLANDYIDNIEVRLIRIDFNIKNNHYEEAGKDLKYIIHKNSGNSNAWKQLIYIESYLNHYDSVIYYANMALNLFKEDATLYIMKGLAYMQLGKNEEALKVLLSGDKYSSSNEEKVQIYGYLGELYRNTNDNKLSDNYFEKALELDEHNILLRNNYSYYLALRNTALKKAEKLSRYTIEKEPENATYLDTYAWILYKMKKYKEALRFIEKAIKYGGENNAEILDHYGDILMGMKKYEKAINIWQQVLEMAENEQARNKIDEATKLIKSIR